MPNSEIGSAIRQLNIARQSGALVKQYCEIKGALLTCVMLGFIGNARADGSCPKFHDNSQTGKPAIQEMKSSQEFGIKSDPSNKFVANGAVVGGNAYDVISDISGWFSSAPFPGATILTAHSPSVTSNNPFSVELPWNIIKCLLRENVNVLISDGTYNHFTQFWRVDWEKQQYSFADRQPDAFFLANGNNLLGIKAKRQAVKHGPAVHWISEDEFKDVFSELLYPADDDDFVKLYESSSTTEGKARVAYAAFLSSGVYSDDLGIGSSLQHALRVFDNFDGLTEQQKIRFPKEVGIVLSIAQVTNGKPPSEAMLVPEFDIDIFSQIARWNSKSEKVRIQISLELMNKVSEYLKALQAVEMPDYFGAGPLVDASLGDIQVLLAERLAKTAVLYGPPQKALQVVSSSIENYPSSPRLILYAATLDTKTKNPKVLLDKLQEWLERLEKLTLTAGRVDDLQQFRKAIQDYGIEEHTAEASYTAWTTLLTTGRRLAEKYRADDVALRFAKKELFVVYSQSDETFCENAGEYAKEQKSRALTQASANLKQSLWFGVACNRKLSPGARKNAN